MKTMEIVRTKEEIDKLIEEAIENDGKFYNETYEQGVRNAIDWLFGDTDDNPME